MQKRETNYNTEINKVVVRNDFIEAIHPEKMDLKTMKLFRLVISQCRKVDKELYAYEFKITDLAKIIGVDSSNYYKDAQNMCINMMQMILKYGGGDLKQSWKLKHIFESCQYDSRDGIITIELHEDMSELLLRLDKKFTKIPISDVLMMKSKYAIRLYELICEKMMDEQPHADVSVCIQLTLDEIRKATGTENKKAYEKISNLKNNILIPAINDIEASTRKKDQEQFTGWKILVRDLKRGRRVTGFELEIWDRNSYEVVERYKRTGESIPESVRSQVNGQLTIYDYMD